MPHTSVRSNRLPTVSETALQELALLAQRGDDAALERLLGQLQSILKPWIYGGLIKRGRFRCDSDVDDILQDILISIWQIDLPKFDATKGHLLGFLRQRVAWRVGDSIRREARSRTEEWTEINEQCASLEYEHTPDQKLAQSQHEQKLWLLPHVVAEALDELSETADPAAAHAVRAHDLEGRPLREVAQELQVHVSNACRARQRGLHWISSKLDSTWREAA